MSLSTPCSPRVARSLTNPRAQRTTLSLLSEFPQEAGGMMVSDERFKDLEEKNTRLKELEKWLSDHSFPRPDDVLACVRSMDGLMGKTCTEMDNMTQGWDISTRTQFFDDVKDERFQRKIIASLLEMVQSIDTDDTVTTTPVVSRSDAPTPPFLTPLLEMVQSIADDYTAGDPIESPTVVPTPIQPPRPAMFPMPNETISIEKNKGEKRKTTSEAEGSSLRKIQRGTGRQQQSFNRAVLKSVPVNTRVRFTMPTNPRAHLKTTNGRTACLAYESYSLLGTVGEIITSGNSSNFLYDLGRGWAELIDGDTP